MTDKIRVLSLFSGCGGMDLGLEGGFLAPKKSFGANETVIVDEKCINGFVRVPKSRFETVFANDILKDFDFTPKYKVDFIIDAKRMSDNKYDLYNMRFCRNTFFYDATRNCSRICSLQTR